MKRKVTKRVRTKRESVNDFYSTFEAWQGSYAEECRGIKSRQEFERWVVRKLAGLTALYVSNAQKRVRKGAA